MANDSTIRAIARAEAEKALAIGGTWVEVNTEDDTPTTVTEATVIIPDYTSGFIEWEIIGQDEVGTGKFSAKVITGIFRDTALAIDAPDVLHTADSLTADFNIVDDGSGNAAIQVIGVAATPIMWRVRTKQSLNTIIPVAP